MKKKLLLILTLCMAFSLTACKTEKVEEQKEETTSYKTYTVKDEIINSQIKDGKVQILDNVITFPIKYSDFISQTNLSVNKAFSSDFDSSYVLKEGEEKKIYLTSNDTDVLVVTIKNDTQSLKMAMECNIVSIQLSKTTSKEINDSLKNIVYMPYGITYDKKFTDYKDKLKKIDSKEKQYDTNMTINYTQDNYSLAVLYDTETEKITEIIYKVNN